MQSAAASAEARTDEQLVGGRALGLDAPTSHSLIVERLRRVEREHAKRLCAAAGTRRGCPRRDAAVRRTQCCAGCAARAATRQHVRRGAPLRGGACARRQRHAAVPRNGLRRALLSPAWPGRRSVVRVRTSERAGGTACRRARPSLELCSWRAWLRARV